MAYPCRIVPLVAMAVGEIRHHLALADLVVLIDLPEDDAAGLGGTQAILPDGTLQLALREIAICNQCLAEQTLGRECPAPLRGIHHQLPVEHLDLIAQLAAETAERGSGNF